MNQRNKKEIEFGEIDFVINDINNIEKEENDDDSNNNENISFL